ncbi:MULTISPECIES: cytochrome P460 family protein [Acidobacteriaceae]|uniref:cytochrome P460 family protein n=1 Tax=Acidobacteriaceae TaxID=204434 RepID=UPI0020B133E3|nr:MULTISPECIES: cytochrome P460 family protein [Acidobacteriaceae]MDW5267668.1 cytochrome P460 family protein [Edaphobacter sp.]
MVKDSRKYAETGGWGFAKFADGKPANEAEPKACFSCHEPAKLGTVFLLTTRDDRKNGNPRHRSENASCCFHHHFA